MRFVICLPALSTLLPMGKFGVDPAHALQGEALTSLTPSFLKGLGGCWVSCACFACMACNLVKLYQHTPLKAMPYPPRLR